MFYKLVFVQPRIKLVYTVIQSCVIKFYFWSDPSVPHGHNPFRSVRFIERLREGGEGTGQREGPPQSHPSKPHSFNE